MPPPTSMPPSGVDRRAQWTQWGTMGFSILMYFAISRVIPPREFEPGSSLIVTVLMVVAIALVAASFAVKGRISTQTDPARKRGFYTMALVMCDGAAILGIVAKFAFASPQYYWFLALGLAGILIHYPRREE